eukprot:6605451-Pyramimonas_sp.AAC.2
MCSSGHTHQRSTNASATQGASSQVSTRTMSGAARWSGRMRPRRECVTLGGRGSWVGRAGEVPERRARGQTPAPPATCAPV